MSIAVDKVRSVQSPVAARLEFLAAPAQAKTAVAFVHGLGGHRLKSWGAVGQPGAFMKRLQADLPHAAVATYDYASEVRTIVSDDSLTLQTMARSWAQSIRKPLLTRFDTVAIIAHCLGGLLTTTAVCALLAGRGPPGSSALRKKKLVLFLLDAPHDLPEAGPDPWLAGFLNALKLEPSALRAHAAVWRRRVLVNRTLPLAIQAYALTSGPTGWVTTLHPDADLPPARVCKVRQSHEELTRAPAEGPFMPYDFVLSRLRELL